MSGASPLLSTCEHCSSRSTSPPSLFLLLFSTRLGRCSVLSPALVLGQDLKAFPSCPGFTLALTHSCSCASDYLAHSNKQAEQSRASDHVQVRRTSAGAGAGGPGARHGW